MKIVEDNIVEKVNEERIIPIPKEFKFLGSFRKIKGLTLYGWNVQTGEIKPLEIEKKVFVGIDGKPVSKKNCTINPNEVMPIQALNLKNAARKVRKILRQWKEIREQKV